MTGRSIIFILAGIIMISGVILFNIEAASTGIVQNMNHYYLKQAALNIAQSGVNMGLSALKKDTAWRAGFSSRNLLNGTVTVTAKDTIFDSVPVVALSSRGISAYGTRQADTAYSTVYIYRPAPPPPVRGLIMSCGPLNFGGNYIIDGRDHTLAGSLISSGKGTWGVWSTSNSYIQAGTSLVGGSANGTDYAPTQNPTDSVVIRLGQTYPGGYPHTPDSILGGSSHGFPEGTLKKIAQSGIGNSQYVTDPLKLTFPLSGVTYIELPPGGIWAPSGKSGTVSGSGVLVVHNSSGNSYLSGKFDFNGIIISDVIQAVNGGTILGAINILSPNPANGNPHYGTGNAIQLYSSAAIKNSVDFLMNARQKILGPVVAWWE